ncbi:MAG: DUF438 domain-containing protein [Bacteroidales bacterium]|nr:DUF438 domain-containing protein [Bacteroidales bacterium]
MSAFTHNKESRLLKLKEAAVLLLNTGNAHAFIMANKDFIPRVIPSDFISLFDDIMAQGHAIEDVKALTNKMLNVFHIPIMAYKRPESDPASFLGLLEQNNQQMEQLLHAIRPVFKAFVQDEENTMLMDELAGLFRRLEQFSSQYTIKENVLFPVIEQAWPDYRCLQIMWSFHDDIRRNIRIVVDQLTSRTINIKQFKRCVGDVFFNMLAIKFREEHILFPHILETIDADQLELMTSQGAEIGFPFVQPALAHAKEKAAKASQGMVDLGTGELSIDQLVGIFNHLPVDITYVDEQDVVRFFSTPPKRIFPRTKAIIGRKVSNCHPPESVHIVEQIISAFRSGEKSQADFWIRMKGEMIFIRYFAVRDANGTYKGVIEVSQEVSEIQALEGEKRLLDW